VDYENIFTKRNAIILHSYDNLEKNDIACVT